MRVTELMSTDVRTAQLEESAENAWQRMQREHIRHLVVVSHGEVVGVVSEPELGPGGPLARDGKTIESVMVRRVVSVTPETTLNRAANLLRAKQALCLPVMYDGRLVGLVTASDLLEQMGRGRGNKARPLPRIRSSRPSNHPTRR